MIENPKSSVCALCDGEGELRDSHVVPAFVAKWIKETSATGYLRGYQVPNQRMQDLPTTSLLCDECEQRFSVAEKKFAEMIFRPFTDGRSRFPYQDWLLYFATSLSWRCLASSNGEGLQDHPEHRAAVDRAKEAWADFLLGRTDNVGPYRFNLFFT